MAVISAEDLLRFLKVCPDSRAQLCYHLFLNDRLTFEEIQAKLGLTRDQIANIARWFKSKGLAEEFTDIQDRRTRILHFKRK